MLDILIVRNYKVVYNKEIDVKKDINRYAENLKNIAPNKRKMEKMQNKFLQLVDKDSEVSAMYKIAMTTTIISTANTLVAYAEPLAEVSEKIRTITSPVIELLAGLGYPVTYGMLICGALMVITGKKSKGLDILKWACMGYIGLQFVPFLLGLLEMIGKELRMSL